MNYLLAFAAFLCAFIAELVALGVNLHNSTWNEWVAGALIAYFLSLLVPWVSTRRAA